MNNLYTKLYLAAANVLVADGEGSYTTALTKLKTVLCDVSKALGIIIIAYGGIKFAISFQKLDQQGEHQAAFSILAGGILLALGALCNALGAV